MQPGEWIGLGGLVVAVVTIVAAYFTNRANLAAARSTLDATWQHELAERRRERAEESAREILAIFVGMTRTSHKYSSSDSVIDALDIPRSRAEDIESPYRQRLTTVMDLMVYWNLDKQNRATRDYETDGPSRGTVVRVACLHGIDVLGAFVRGEPVSEMPEYLAHLVAVSDRWDRWMQAQMEPEGLAASPT